MTAIKSNAKIQIAIIIIDAFAILILGPIMMASQGAEGAFFDFAFTVFEKFTLPIVILSLFTLISVFFIDMKENWMIFLPIYIIDLICIIGNVGYILWITIALFGFV